MARCRVVQENLTAWIDGEASDRWDTRIRDHLAACVTCAAEAESLRAAVAHHRRALGRTVAVDDVDLGSMAARLRRALAGEPEEAEPMWNWTSRPFALVGAALMVAMVLLAVAAGGASRVLIPLGVQSPPPAVTRAPDLFKDYELINHLDALENFDTVQSVPLDDESSSQRG
jgi:anti-sigma factor RsiW